MGPGMLGLDYTPETIRFATRQVVEKMGGTFIKAKVTRIDADRQTVFCEDGRTCPYDVLSFNAGSFVPSGVVEGETDRIYTVKPIERLLEARQRIVDMGGRQFVRVAVVGGGAAAVEVSGNVWRLLSEHGRHGFEVGLYSRGTLLNRFPARVRAAARRSLLGRGIRVSENRPVAKVRNRSLELKSGHGIDADFIFLATGVRPSPIFKASGLPTGPDGGLLVNDHLQSTAYENIFGGGDCIHYKPRPLDKVGVYAVRQNPVLYHNVMAALESTPLATFDPGGAYLLIFNMGDGTGVLYKNGLLLRGRLAFVIKDYIDRRFMRKFQAIE
jgi:NADH dehydrogenase FAD-containing subunit